VRCHNMALGRTQSAVPIPRFDYGQPGDFGCAEVHPTRGPQVGQRPLEYDEVPLRTLDSFHLHQLDVLKVDVEGMELEVLQGAERTIRECRPAMLVEWHKSDRGELENWLWEHGYSIELRGRDLLALP